MGHRAPAALIVSWDANPLLEPSKDVLREQFGYNTISLRLPKQDSEKVLKRELANALISHSGMNNPFILYYYGDSLVRQGQSRLILSKSIVQILVAPKSSQQNATPFPDILAKTLKAMIESSTTGVIDMKDLESEISRHPEPEYSAVLYSLRRQQENLKLQVCSYERQDTLLDMRYEQRVPSNASKYSHVSVLPITWAQVDRWDAEAEIKELLDVFEEHFDFLIESIVKIPNTPDAQSSLQSRIDLQIEEVEPNGLLIVVYNGHARRTNEGMIISATKGVQEEKQTQVEMANAADLKTNESEFHGINETLAAGAREEQVPAGPNSSMKVFAMVCVFQPRALGH
ncbi:hypothetical protein FACUT_10578 [Fusarium acutatum]|uniref:Uncharacterized protein n=1 Tax=Fusarium acutatum TaxID=78861 RepID=A0A8H4JIY8_9HYPO|nr:hypothetical protein FACUT_10578 [Fusarium acutatum]